jgi:hypothetical protein
VLDVDNTDDENSAVNRERRELLGEPASTWRRCIDLLFELEPCGVLVECAGASRVLKIRLGLRDPHAPKCVTPGPWSESHRFGNA